MIHYWSGVRTRKMKNFNFDGFYLNVSQEPANAQEVRSGVEQHDDPLVVFNESAV